MTIEHPLSGRAPAPGYPLALAKEVRKLILSGRAPDGFRVRGCLSFRKERKLTRLPAGLQADALELHDCENITALPRDLRVRRLTIAGCRYLRELPPGLSCYELEMRGALIRSLPADLRVEYRLDLEGCARLEALPPGLKVGSLILRGCVSLEALPEGLDVSFLDVSGCVRLAGWPRSGAIRGGRLNASGCSQIRELPSWLTEVSQLDLSGCSSLGRLPEGLRIGSWVDLAGTDIRSLPESLRGVRLRWRGALVDERIVFRPETITAGEVLSEQNAEVRRALLDRMGYDAFLAEAKAKVLDTDRDAGGERRLLRVPLPGDEPLVCVAVICPSTGRQYVLRVPPTMRTCRQAVAWIAGFDNEKDYRPVAET